MTGVQTCALPILPLIAPDKKLTELKQLISGFKERDYKVTLGAILDPETWDYYAKNGFQYLSEKITCRTD